MVVEIFTLVLAVGTAVLKVGDFFGITPAEQEMHAARMHLDAFNGTLLELQSSRDRLGRELKPDQRRLIDQHLQTANSLAQVYEKALKNYVSKEGILKLKDRAAWVLKQKNQVEIYKGALILQQATLGRQCQEMAWIEATRPDPQADEKPAPRRRRQADVSHAAVGVGHDTRRLVEAAGSSEDERLDLSPVTAVCLPGFRSYPPSESAENAILSKFKPGTSISADLKRRYERNPSILPPPQIPVSITADLERRFAQREPTTE